MCSQFRRAILWAEVDANVECKRKAFGRCVLVRPSTNTSSSSLSSSNRLGSSSSLSSLTSSSIALDIFVRFLPLSLAWFLAGRFRGVEDSFGGVERENLRCFGGVIVMLMWSLRMTRGEELGLGNIVDGDARLELVYTSRHVYLCILRHATVLEQLLCVDFWKCLF